MRFRTHDKGLTPDYEIDNPPHASFFGADAQLDFALRLIQDENAKNARPALDPAPRM